ncbi:SNF2 family N-terminal domain-containing protein [Dichotomopilus funicola]|uniref:SNF2 family N-terminal domain-containing protein n=1 Tax=Dichotomopilus funicola TaxID=1934379 RepID=A0AAN6V7M9_9PEZI|nr:SNF2 family N-terminal domain-containing protein [Dichotomopilus funicola]
MAQEHDRGDWQWSSWAPAASATLRPPKRHKEGDDVQSASPKRQRPSPSPDISTSHPVPLLGSETLLHIDIAPPVLSSSSSPASADSANSGSVPVNSASSQGALPQVDWVPTGGPTVDDSDPRICYGALCNVKARFKPAGEARLLVSGDRTFCLLRVVSSSPYYALATRSHRVVADLDLTTCRSLRSLEGLPGLRSAAVIESTAVYHSQEKGIVPLSINVYGPLSSADQVGSVLSAASAFLQHPFFLEPGCKDYFNPQIFRTGNEMQNLTHLVGLTEKDLKAKAISDGIQHILDSLDEIALSNGPENEASWEPQHLLTRLTKHQVAALGFIQRRECLHHCQAMHQKLRHFTNILYVLSPNGTSCERRFIIGVKKQNSSHDNIPSYTTGGILADVMGLGKTLTMIATITSTLAASRQYLSNSTAHESGVKTGATLVVVTSVQVLDVWETEIKKHVEPEKLRTYRFHGRNRPASPGVLNGFDVVLTTYATLCAEQKKRGILHQVDWYRVVLDEAHWIRNQGSKQFKNAADLRSLRRWCLTGTPIQNSLNDLVSLLGFLHFEPFSSRTLFGRHIVEPLANDMKSGGERLKEILRTICLRRDQRLLQLPQPRHELVEVVLQQEERALYDRILAQYARDLDDVVSSRAKVKRYGILFAAIMKLRRLCNHGTFAASPPTDSADQTEPGHESELGCEFCNGADEDMLELVNQDNVCSECGRELLSTTTSCSQAPAPKITFRLGESKPYSDTEGFSSKVQAVINRLSQTEPGSKSLVFSYWTATLNVLEQHLRTRGVRYLRIDGNSTHSARLRVLEEFRNQDASVLLMTVGTGAVGLNLTAANYVHIVEPQWNPAVEEQAIARALRMGQTRTVTIIRYVVKSSVEENIFHLQRRKQGLAKFTLDGVSQDGVVGALDDLRFVLDLDLVG